MPAFITGHAELAPTAKMPPSPLCWLFSWEWCPSGLACCSLAGSAWWGCCSILDRFQRTGKGLWLLAAVVCAVDQPARFLGLWHGRAGLTIASGLVEGEWGLVVARRWTSGELKKLLLAFAASLAALFVNPFGYKLVLYPFDLLFRQPSNMKHIEEWHSVDFSNGNGKLALIVIFGLLAAALFSRPQLEAG